MYCVCPVEIPNPFVPPQPTTSCIVNAFAWCTALPVSVPAVHATTFLSNLGLFPRTPHLPTPISTIHFPPVAKRPGRKKFASHSNASKPSDNNSNARGLGSQSPGVLVPASYSPADGPISPSKWLWFPIFSAAFEPSSASPVINVADALW